MTFVLYSEAELYELPAWHDVPEERMVRCRIVYSFYRETLFDSDYEAAPCLAYIHPYINTVYNRLQMPAFLEQWRRLFEQDLTEKS